MGLICVGPGWSQSRVVSHLLLVKTYDFYRNKHVVKIICFSCIKLLKVKNSLFLTLFKTCQKCYQKKDSTMLET